MDNRVHGPRFLSNRFEVLEQNNRLAELRMEERDEVERILRELTGMLAQEVMQRIEIMISALAAIDAIAARARFGIEYDAAVPVVSPEGEVRFRSARHPLLVWKAKAAGGAGQVQPNDIVINRDARVLILSGPNAGGKTAVLKTVGVLCLMAQAGLPVTAAEGSELPCFGSFFADIGDEQSLEQNLSTFSSHVSQIAEILRLADEHSLVLLDELGSGTDPAEGAGLGAAVLESLIDRGCVTMITTHQNALKLFGRGDRRCGQCGHGVRPGDPAAHLSPDTGQTGQKLRGLNGGPARDTGRRDHTCASQAQR